MSLGDVIHVDIYTEDTRQEDTGWTGQDDVDGEGAEGAERTDSSVGVSALVERRTTSTAVGASGRQNERRREREALRW